MTMRVEPPQVLATFRPPPPGMLRSQTTRSGRVRPMTSMASSASPASPTTWKVSPRSARTPLRQMGWSSHSTTFTALRLVLMANSVPRDPAAHAGAVLLTVRSAGGSADVADVAGPQALHVGGVVGPLGHVGHPGDGRGAGLVGGRELG